MQLLTQPVAGYPEAVLGNTKHGGDISGSEVHLDEGGQPKVRRSEGIAMLFQAVEEMLMYTFKYNSEVFPVFILVTVKVDEADKLFQFFALVPFVVAHHAVQLNPQFFQQLIFLDEVQGMACKFLGFQFEFAFEIFFEQVFVVEVGFHSFTYCPISPKVRARSR